MTETNPIDEIEAKQAMKSMAAVTWSFYSDLVEQGFAPAAALKLTDTWLRATSTPQQGGA